MSHREVSIEALNETLLQESSKPFQESPGLDVEWKHFTTLYNVVAQINQKERGRNGRNGSDTDLDPEKDLRRRVEALPRFMQWLQDHGVNTSRLEITNMGTSKGLGVVTKVELSSGEEVLVIPEKLMMTTMNARESKLGILVGKDPVLGSMPNVVLSLFLLYEKYVSKEGSFWKAYIDLLPSFYNTTLYFTLDDMLLLKNSAKGCREAVRMYRNIVRQYAYFHGVFRKASDSASRAFRTIFTFQRYAWAASTAMTRQNNLVGPINSKEELCLIPLWDMCNHETTGRFANGFNPDQKRLSCYSTHEYEVGQEFLIFYGKRTSIEHFIHGGFVPNTSVYDNFTLDIGIGTHDKDLSRKTSILKEFGLKPQESFVVNASVLAELLNLFVFIRIFQADNELLTTLETNPERSFLTKPSTPVWKFLSARFTLLGVSAFNAKSTVLRSLCKDEEVDKSNITSRQNMILQLLQNEIQHLQVLAQLAKYQSEQEL